MSAIISKATNVVNGLVTKSTQVANSALYWTKVGAEVGKVVYKKEGLAPPSGQQFQQLYQNALKFVQSPAQQKEFLSKAAQIQPNKETAVKAAVYGTQLLAFFSIGEIIGRRSIFGYPSSGSHH
ncbi:uncharacterized protein CANTADRAFT_7473 [Suhomyces tanzawaensis NRRL Y-17324]|uniref:Uncharacterized protein n=1 Tax=Suhomyces tanzawaensis NRRL Y-17324 TaxID=984487 RepID=A0A1E4SES2_9ASCO|nr:uncharacterized protein CANTADRAFT_7473 [Suhomyces tanzawaensis NRRL Y-17324]ODV78005.1 hypothetical protein CANTADRAFT_7473 [Suhomyces tanzawaensis NRRL Y-17324]